MTKCRRYNMNQTLECIQQISQLSSVCILVDVSHCNLCVCVWEWRKARGKNSPPSAPKIIYDHLRQVLIHLSVPGHPLCLWTTYLSLDNLSVPGHPLCPWTSSLSLDNLSVPGQPLCPWTSSLSLDNLTVPGQSLCPWTTSLSLDILSVPGQHRHEAFFLLSGDKNLKTTNTCSGPLLKVQLSECTTHKISYTAVSFNELRLHLDPPTKKNSSVKFP